MESSRHKPIGHCEPCIVCCWHTLHNALDHCCFLSGSVVRVSAHTVACGAVHVCIMSVVRCTCSYHRPLGVPHGPRRVAGGVTGHGQTRERGGRGCGGGSGRDNRTRAGCRVEGRDRRGHCRAAERRHDACRRAPLALVRSIWPGVPWVVLHV